MRLHPVIEAHRREALRRIHAAMPQWDAGAGAYVCRRCGSSGDKGFRVWHTCGSAEANTAKFRLVGRTAKEQ